MKKVIYFLLVLIIFSACGNNKSDQEVIDAKEVYIWKAGLNDSTGLLEMKKVLSGDMDSITVASLLKSNSTDQIKLEFKKQSNDTVFIKIPDATVLTQQMGSTGPTIYLAGLVYNLTEIPGIHYVNLDFEEGDHAGPGTYSRDNFKDN